MKQKEKSIYDDIVRRNVISSILLWIGVFEMAIMLFVGLNYISEDAYWIAYSSWAGGFVAGMLIIGFSEALNLLQQLLDKLK